MTNVTNPTERETIREVIVREGEVDTSRFVTQSEYDLQLEALLRSTENSSATAADSLSTLTNSLASEVDTATLTVSGNGSIGDSLTVTNNATIGGTLTAGSLAVSSVSSTGAVTAPYFTATSTTATSTFPHLEVANTSSLGTVISGTWNGTAIDISDYTNLTVTATGLELAADAIALTSGYHIPLTASTTNWATAYGWGDHSLAGYLIAANNLSDLASTSTARTNLGVDPAGTDNSTNVTLAGALDYLTIVGQEITRNAIDLATDTTGQLADGNFVKTGDWTGLFDGQEGSWYQDRANHTGTQTASTIADFSATARGLFSNTTTGLTYDSDTGITSLTSGYHIPLTASTTAWNSFFNTPSNRITAGTGLSWSDNTLNSVWTTSGNDIYSNNSGNVGIGTTGPSQKLHVVGNSLFQTSAGSLSILDAGVASAQILGSGTVLVNGGASSGVVLGYNGGTEGLRLSNTGNVGIGTGSPSNLLHVVGNQGGQTTVLGLTNFNGGQNSTVDIDFKNSNADTTTARIGSVRTNALTGGDTDIAFSTYGGGSLAERVRIGATGNVGIGTTTPSAKLHITGTAGSDDIFAISSSTNTKLFTVNAAGNVGIGNIPAYELGTSRLTVRSSGNDTNAQIWQASDGTYLGQFYELGDGAGLFSINDAAGDTTISFRGDGTTSYISSGNFGIGTTTPTQTLSVVGLSAVSGGADALGVYLAGGAGAGSGPSARDAGHVELYGGDGTDSNSAGGSIYIKTGSTPGVPVSGQPKLYLQSDRSGGTSLGYVAVGGTSAASLLSVNGNGSFGSSYASVAAPTNGLIVEGNVGIGTSSPSEKLEVWGEQVIASGANPSIVDNTYGTGLLIVNDGSSNAFHALRIVTDTDSTNIEALAVTNAGNVGIGTTDPGSKLTVSGGDITISDGTEPSANSKYLFFENGSTSRRGYVGVDFSSSASGNGTTLVFGTNPEGGSEVERMRITTTGNVGIGTTNPSSFKLQVAGNVGPDANTTYNIGSTGLRYGCIWTSGGSTGTCASDERLKYNIEDLTFGGDALQQLSSLRLRTFLFNDDPNNNETLGLIAQEALETAPSLVDIGDDGYYRVRYGHIQWMTVAAVQDLNLKLEDLATTTLYTDLDDESFTKTFFNKLISWFADATNGIGDFFANRVRTKELCVADNSGSETCITKTQLDALLQSASSGGGGGTVVPTTTPPPEPTPEEPVVEETPVEEGEQTEEPPAEPEVTEEPVEEETIVAEETEEVVGATAVEEPATEEPQPEPEPSSEE